MLSELSDVEYVERARNLQEAGNLAAANIEFKNALRVNPSNGEARRLLGMLYLQVGDGFGAEKELRRALESKVSMNAIALPLAQAVFFQNDFSRLLSMRVDERLPVNQRAVWYALRGRAQLALRHPKEAEAEFETGLQIDPNSSDVGLGNALLLFYNGNYAGAAGVLDKVLAVQPSFAEALTLRGDAWLMSGKLAEAESLYTKAIGARANNLLDYVKRAQVRIDEGHLQEAKADVDHVAALVPKSVDVFFLRGVLAYRQGRYESAESFLREAIRLRPNDVIGATYLGIVLTLRGQPQQAETLFQQVLAQQPRNYPVGLLLAKLLLQKKSPDQAEHILRRFRFDHDEDERFLSVYGEALVRSGNLVEGVAWTRRWTQVAPNSSRAYLALGAALLDMNDATQAEKAFSEAIRLNPKGNDADAMLVMFLLKEKRYSEALSVVDRWKQRLSDDQAGDLALGQVYLAMGKKEDARELFETMEKKFPDNIAAQQNLVALDLADARPEEAKARLDKILHDKPGNAEAVVALATFDMRAGNVQHAIERLENFSRINQKALQPRVLLASLQLMQGKPDRAIESLREVEYLYGSDPRWGIMMAEAMLYRGDGLGARAILNRFDPEPTKSAVAAYLRARSYSLTGDAEKVSALLEQAYKLDQKNLLVGIALMRNYIESGKINEGVSVLVDLERMYPTNQELVTQRAWLESRTGSVHSALSLLESRLAKKPTRALLLEVVRLKISVKDINGAISTLLVWLNADLNRVRDEEIVRKLTNLLLASGESDEAVKWIEKGISLGLKDPVMFNNIAWALRDKNVEKARSFAEQAVAMAPNSPGAMDTLGVILVEQGDLARGMRLIDEALRVSKGDTLIYLHKVEALIKSGQKELARSELNNVVKLLDSKSEPMTEPLRAKVVDLQRQLNTTYGDR